MSGIIIALLRFFYRFFDQTGKFASFLTILAFLAVVYFTVRFVFRAVRLFKDKRPKRAVWLIVLAVYFLISAWKLTYYFDGSTKSVQPELIAELDGTVEFAHAETYFKINRFPFTLDSMYLSGTDGPKRSHCPDIDISELRAIVDVKKPYTYIISYGRRVDLITYNCWDGSDYLPAPWDGRIMQASLVYSPNGRGNLWMLLDQESVEDEVYVYRMPLTPVDKEP